MENNTNIVSQIQNVVTSISTKDLQLDSLVCRARAQNFSVQSFGEQMKELLSDTD